MYTDTYGMPIISDISKYFTGCTTTPNGTKEYFVAGELVKRVYYMGDTLNYKRGKFHCLDGPAIIRPNNTEWWVEGNFRYRKGVVLPRPSLLSFQDADWTAAPPKPYAGEWIVLQDVIPPDSDCPDFGGNPVYFQKVLTEDIIGYIPILPGM